MRKKGPKKKVPPSKDDGGDRGRNGGGEDQLCPRCAVESWR